MLNVTYFRGGGGEEEEAFKMQPNEKYIH